MTYLQFHLVFILPAILLLWVLQRRPMAGVGRRPAWRAIGLVMVIAFVYTIPWDNFLVYSNIWGYPPGRVLMTIGYVPIEEYAFFLLQPVLTGLWLCLIRESLTVPRVEPPRGFRYAMTGFWLVLSLVGVAMLFGEDSRYMGLILAWACPVLAGMSWIGAEMFWNERRAWLVGIAVPTVYLWIADAIAIRLGIWEIYVSMGSVAGLPVEEAVFFLITNYLCVQGVLLFLPSVRTRL